MMVDQHYENLNEIGTALMRVLTENVPQLDMAYSIWLESQKGSDPLQHQANFRGYLLWHQPELAMSIDIVLPIFWEALTLAADLVNVEFTPALQERLEQIQDKLAECAPQVKDVEGLVALL